MEPSLEEISWMTGSVETPACGIDVKIIQQPVLFQQDQEADAMF